MKNFYIKTIASFAVIGTMIFWASQVDAQKRGFFYEETSCSKYSQYADIDPNNDQCFIGGTLYVSGALSVPYMADYFTNKNNFDVALFENTKLGPGFTYEFKPRQNGVVYAVSPKTGMFKYTGIDTAYTINGSKYNAQIIPANSGKTLIAETVDDSYFSIHKVAKNTNKDLPIMSLTYTTRVFAAIKDKKGVINFTSPSVHKEHAFFKAAWCGDGVVDTQFGEKYDDGPNNGKPGYASTDCTKKVEPETPPVNGICDGASAGIPTYKAPTTNLCKTGTPSVVVARDNKFTWTCGGSNNGTNATCEAPKKVDPVVPPIGKCDQYFNEKIRVGYRYAFPDFYTNSNNYPHTLNSFNVYFKESHDMNGDGSLIYDKFQWASPVKVGYQVPGGTKDLRVIEANPTYRLHIPPAKRQKDNIYIEYTINSTSKWGGGNHKECISYEVTWCGDGILDADEGEKCDPNDPTKTGWGPGGCNPRGIVDENRKDISCQPKESPIKESPTLEIKKLVKGQDAQTRGQQVSVKPGEEYDYTFEVTNNSKVTAKGAKVVDIFPDAITVVKTGTGPGWSCTQNGQTMTCEYRKPIPAGKKAPPITATAKLKDTVQSGDSIRNVAGVCELDPTKPANDPNCTPNRDECKPGDKDYNPTTKTCDPSTVVVGNSVDLSLKKYVDENNDAQPGSPAEKANNSTFDYTIKVKVKSGKATGVTTVKDVLPEKIQSTGKAYGTGWTCSYSVKTLTCTSTTERTAGSYFPDIVVPVRIVNASNGETIRNDATVYNLNEKDKSCHPGNKMISGSEKFDSTAEGCKVDPKNTDPALVKILTPPPPPPSTPPGPGGSVPPPTTPTPPGPGGYTPWCGNYIVEVGEQCDDGPKGSSTCGAPGTSLACKMTGDISTNPAENALTFSIKIPSFSKTAIWSSSTKPKLFKDNGMIVGIRTKIFALSDTVQLEFNSNFPQVAISVPADYEFQIKSNNSNLVEWQSASKKLANTVNSLPSYVHPNGPKYYIIGKKDSRFRIPAGIKNPSFDESQCTNVLTIDSKKIAGNGIKECTLDNDTSSLDLFNGSELQTIKASALTTSGQNAEVAVFVKGQDDYISLASFPVQVINSKVSTTGSSVSRQLATFKNFQNTSSKFLTKLSTTTSTTTDANSNKDSFPFGTTVSPLNANISKDCSEIRNTNDLEKFKHNGNSNVYACKGDLKISTDLQMQGVKTILVQGNIIIDSNINYKSGDNNASWAFIAKGGDIKVANQVTNISGVFASLKETNGGNITGLENYATYNILTVDGTLYGNAQELFKKRTYARASNSYDILTTGTVLNYSNRALRNPPPLLSNYLNHYKVQRVVR